MQRQHIAGSDGEALETQGSPQGLAYAARHVAGDQGEALRLRVRGVLGFGMHVMPVRFRLVMVVHRVMLQRLVMLVRRVRVLPRVALGCRFLHGRAAVSPVPGHATQSPATRPR